MVTQAPQLEEQLVPTPSGQPESPQSEETLDTMGVNMPNLMDEYKISSGYTEKFTRDFADLDNLVDGVPINRQDGAPFVGDTTLAGLVRDIPRQSLKQLPVLSMTINGSKNSIPALVSTYLLKKTAFNESTFGKGLLSTLQMGAEQALTHGYAPTMTASGSMFDDFGTTMRLLHYADVGLEPGVSDSNESDYHFVKAHLTKPRIRRIIKKEAANPDTPWNLPALRKLLESDPSARSYTVQQSNPKKTPGNEDLGNAYDIVTRYETGKGSQFVTFCPQLAEAPLRVMENRSKWGYPKVQYLVIDPAALTPFGTSRVRLASPNQNFMNIYYGSTASMLLLNSNPPLLKRGMFTGPTPLKRGVTWETTDTQADISLKTLDNGALSQFTNFANYFASQIQNIMGGQSLTVNAGSQGAMFGKTAPGVQAGKDFMGIQANQIANILENFLRQYALVAIDTLLSEQTGTAEVILDDETSQAVNEASIKLNGVPLIGPDNVFPMNWDAFYAGIKTWEVNVDVSISPDEMEAKKSADLQDMLTTLIQNAQVLGPAITPVITQITNALLRQTDPGGREIEPMGAVPSLGSVPGGNGGSAEPTGPVTVPSTLPPSLQSLIS